MLALGLDLGSSSIKAALVDIERGEEIHRSQYPEAEMKIQAPELGWAEQNPNLWWEYTCQAIKKVITDSGRSAEEIQCIGISYQMHGLVMVDEAGEPLHSSIIWCDSRAIDIGAQAFQKIGEEHCLSHCLNSPGNFTASKLAWIKENKPEIFSKIDKIMLPGDFLALKLTGILSSTISGLSEGIFWDFKKNNISKELLDHFGFDQNIFPEIKDTFSIQGKLTDTAAADTGLPKGIPIAYRAGDQPNNALSLGVLEPGEIAATGGTSGVVYGVTDQPIFDFQTRINGFAHVNYTLDNPRIGLLLCINGAGAQYAWLRKEVAKEGHDHSASEKILSEIPVGSNGLRIIPFGNGAERMINNKMTGAQINNLQFNTHTRAHMIRAGLEGIAFSFVYGIRVLSALGMPIKQLRVGNDNLFQSAVFSQIISNLVHCKIEVVQTTGAVGAAKGAAYGAGFYTDLKKALANLKIEKTYYPTTVKDKENETLNAYELAYVSWENDLKNLIEKS